MSEQLVRALNFLGVVVTYAAAWFAAFGTLMGTTTLWKFLKRKFDREEVKYEKIIVKKATEKVELEKENQELAAAIEAKKKELADLEQTLEAFEVEDDPEEDALEPEAIDYSKLTVEELRAIAKERKVKGYSRKKKDELLSILNVA